MATTVRREQIALYAMLTSLTAMSIDALLPALRLIEGELGSAPPLAAQHIISLFIFGMVFGELLFGPISDSIGRKKALVIGLGIYAIGTTIALSANSIEAVIVGRLIEGVGVSGPKIATRAMIRDQFSGEAMARIMSFMFTLFILIPMIAPALGQGIASIGGWRGIFLFYLAMTFVLGCWLALRQPETLEATNRIPFRPRLLVRNAARILGSLNVTFLIIATGLVFGAQLVYLSTASTLFSDVYSVTASFPIFFAILAAGIGVASYLNGRLLGRFGMERMARQALRGLPAVGILMLIAALASNGRPPLWLFMALGFCAFFCIGILFGNLNALAMRPLGEIAGLGASLIASGSSLVATIFAVVVGSFYNENVTYLAVGFSLGGFGALALFESAVRSAQTPIEAAR